MFIHMHRLLILFGRHQLDLDRTGYVLKLGHKLDWTFVTGAWIRRVLLPAETFVIGKICHIETVTVKH